MHYINACIYTFCITLHLLSLMFTFNDFHFDDPRDHASVSSGLDYVATWNAGMLISDEMNSMMRSALQQRQRPKL